VSTDTPSIFPDLPLAGANGDKPLILVVDDTPLNLVLMGKLVDRLPGTQAHTFERPIEALTWCLENEADLIGIELAARAGYDPNAAISLWQKMSKAGGGAPPEFMSTHPSSSSRIAALQAAIPKVMPLYQQARK